MPPHPDDDGESASAAPETPLQAQPTDTAATTFTVRYHRGRMLTTAAACIVIWCAAQIAAAGFSWPYKDMLLPIIAVGPLVVLLLATASLNQPYLVFDTAERSLRGPGGWPWNRKYPRRKRPGTPSGVRGSSIFATNGGRERRLPFHRFWAHPDDWAELTRLLADDTRPAPMDWIRIGRVDPIPSDAGRLRIMTDAVRVGSNLKLYRWMLGIGIILWIASCAPLPFVPAVRDFYPMLMIPAIAPFVVGLLGLVAKLVVFFDPWTGTVWTTSRMTGTLAHPHPKYSLEYSARLGHLYRVRADGRRWILINKWTMDPADWKRFTDLLQQQGLMTAPISPQLPSVTIWG